MRSFAFNAAVGLVLLTAAIWVSAQQKHGERESKTVTIQGEVVNLSCYLSHGEKHAKCAIACIKKGLPMGILTDDGKLFVVLEDHAKADAYQQLKKSAAKKVTVTGIVYARGGVTGIAVQKVVAASAAKSGAKYFCPMGCIPPQDKPGNCPKCGMKLVTKK
mgnify:CR=1 FL=1